MSENRRRCGARREAIPGAQAPRETARSRSRVRERGQVLVMVAVMLPVMFGMAALVVDVGHAWVLKRHLQKSADAAALAAAFELPDQTNATTLAHQYSGEPGGHNANDGLPNVTTTVSFPSTVKVKVEQRAQARTFFAGVLGLSPFNIKASAVASRLSTTGGSPLAVYVHELCGASTGNKGLNVAGDNVTVEGGIHVNGQFKISNPGFRSHAVTTVYRPPTAPSVAPPPQGSCNGTSNPAGTPKIENHATARYCTVVCAPGSTTPTFGAWRDWATNALGYTGPYQVLQKVRGMTCGASYAWNNPCCTHPVNGDVTLGNTVITTPRVYCLPPDKKFTLDGTVTGPTGTHGQLTVIAGEFTINSKPGTKIAPYNSSEPVLFWSLKTGGEIVLNSSGALDWVGFAINRNGGITVNSDGVVSPRLGMLEAEWIVVNAPNFQMQGQGPPNVGGSAFGGVALEE